VVAKLDRLARDVNLILSLVDSGVPITFLDLPDLSADPIVGRLVLTIMAAIAEFESRRIGQRIKEAMARRREKLEAKGKRLTRRRLSRKHQREASAAWHRWNRKQMKTFRREFQPLALGLRQSRTLAEVAAEMNARGIATRRRRKWTPVSYTPC
jgi:DNA invertase Pin-like site-specific DNA recombinase